MKIEPEDDELNAARGITIGVGIGLLIWAIVIAVVLHGRVESAPPVCKTQFGSVVPCP